MRYHAPRHRLQGKAIREKVLFGLLLLGFPAAAQPLYSPQQDTVIHGRVIRILQDSTRPRLVQVQVVTPHGDTIQVHLAPRWYLQQRIRLQAGDSLIIRGTLRPGEMVAREVEAPRHRVRMELRTREGFPLWMEDHRAMRRHRGPLYDPSREDTLMGQVVDVREVMPPRGFYPHLEVHMLSPQGDTHRVVLGPTWLVGSRVRPGDTLRIVGSPVPWAEGMRIMAREMENLRLHERMQLRDEHGMPLWRHMGMGMRHDMGGPGMGPGGGGGDDGMGGGMGSGMGPGSHRGR